MVDGLRLTIGGEELRQLLEDRINAHRRHADWWKGERARAGDGQAEDDPLPPEHMCENEAERHEWRAAVLEFIHDRIEPAEVYRLGESDLEFGELLPEKPGWLEQEEHEERTRVGFHLERLRKRVGDVWAMGYALACPQPARDERCRRTDT